MQNFNLIEDLLVPLHYVHNDVAVTEVSVYVLGEEVHATGIALRDPADKPDLEVAALLSYGRALEALGQKLLKRGNGRVKHNDDMRSKKELVKLEVEALEDASCGDADCWCRK